VEPFTMDTNAVQAAANRVTQIARMVLDSFTHAPGAASSAAGANTGYMTSVALMALVGTQLASAFNQLFTETGTQASLLQQSATATVTTDESERARFTPGAPGTGR
jgi:hypothetical protein